MRVCKYIATDPLLLTYATPVLAIGKWNWDVRVVQDAPGGCVTFAANTSNASDSFVRTSGETQRAKNTCSCERFDNVLSQCPPLCGERLPSLCPKYWPRRSWRQFALPMYRMFSSGNQNCCRQATTSAGSGCSRPSSLKVGTRSIHARTSATSIRARSRRPLLREGSPLRQTAYTQASSHSTASFHRVCPVIDRPTSSKSVAAERGMRVKVTLRRHRVKNRCMSDDMTENTPASAGVSSKGGK